MPRFDFVTATLPGCPTTDFHTKELGRELLSYTLKGDRLVRDATGEAIPFNGVLDLVGDTMGDDIYLWEYHLVFETGRLIRVEPIEEGVSLGDLQVISRNRSRTRSSRRAMSWAGSRRSNGNQRLPYPRAQRAGAGGAQREEQGQGEPEVRARQDACRHVRLEAPTARAKEEG